MVWINKNLGEWQVDNLANSSEMFAEIVTKNLPKQQIRICQNSNFGFNKTAASFSRKPSPDKEKQPPKENIKESIDKKKENILLKIFQNYSSKISPLNEKESLLLKDILKSYNPEIVEKAIMIVSSGNERSLSYFLKVLDDLAIRGRRQAVRLSGMESIGSIFKRVNNS